MTANAVAPGYIATDMTAELPEGAAETLLAHIPLGRMGAVEDVAEVVVFAAGRPDHVALADVLLLPADQASATRIHRHS